MSDYSLCDPRRRDEEQRARAKKEIVRYRQEKDKEEGLRHLLRVPQKSPVIRQKSPTKQPRVVRKSALRKSPTKEPY
jgi:hypothetical protein